MDDKRKLTGHPWHVEFLTMDENDTRRHKKRCVYYSQNNSCRKNCGTCIGSSHCSYYKECGANQPSKKKSKGANQPSKKKSKDVNQPSKKQIEEMLRKIFKER